MTPNQALEAQMAPNQALELQAPKETEGTLNLHTKWLQLNLNNLYRLTLPPGRRRYFCLRPAEGRWVLATLFVYWVHRLILSDRFWTKNMNGATSFTSKNGTNILIFQTSQNKESIYNIFILRRFLLIYWYLGLR